MKQSLKGALLSGLVYPGLGQYVLGRKGIGTSYMAVITACIIYIVTRVIKLISVALEQMTQMIEKGSSDIFNPLETAFKSSYGSSWLDNAVPFVILFCWIGSIIHAYLIGRELDRP